MLQVCNSCGGYDHVGTCAHCPTLICRHCRANHERVCAVTSEMKKRGQGPTVRRAEPLFLSVEPTPESAIGVAIEPTDSFVEAGVTIPEVIETADVVRAQILAEPVIVTEVSPEVVVTATLDGEGNVTQEPPVPFVENENKLDDGHTVTV